MELGAHQRGVAHRTDETLDLARKAEGRGGISPSGDGSQSRSERGGHHCAGVDGGGVKSKEMRWVCKMRMRPAFASGFALSKSSELAVAVILKPITQEQQEPQERNSHVTRTSVAISAPFSTFLKAKGCLSISLSPSSSSSSEAAHRFNELERR